MTLIHNRSRGVTCSLLLLTVALASVQASQQYWGVLPYNVASQEESMVELMGTINSRKLQEGPTCASICAKIIKFRFCGADKKSYEDGCVALCKNPNIKIAYLGTCTLKPCLCPGLSAPVCGNGKSYISQCFAKCAGVKSWKTGLCAKDCQCPATKAPVTGEDGKVYGNMCKATCAGTEPAYSGSPDIRIGSCKCAPTYDPVCEAKVITTPNGVGGTIKRTQPTVHLNPCLAACNGARKWTKGVCPKDPLVSHNTWQCGCPTIFKPVCANLGGLKITMSSECAMKCFGMKKVSDGICPGCICPESFSPVCAAKKTYRNACTARCEGKATAWKAGPCTPCSKCPAPTISTYVCGKDGVSYPTACNAECIGATVDYKGFCKT